MLYTKFSTLLVVSLLFIFTSCHKDSPPVSNKPLYLKGMQVGWNERMKKQGTFALATNPQETWFSLSDVQRLKKAGANYVELGGIPLPDLMAERNVPNESYFTNWVDVWVDWCTQNQMYCTINILGLDARWDWAAYLSMPSWLWEGIYTAPSYTDKASCDPIIMDFFDLDIAKQDSNRAAFINLWKFIANRYKDNPYVMFSIMNEPFCGVDIPDEASIHLSQSYSTFMEQIVDAIQSTGATQRVIIDLPFLWDHDRNWQWAVKPVNRDNIVWEAHLYVNVVWTPTLESFKAAMDNLVQIFVNEFKKPLLIGEYGIDPIKDIRTTYASNWKSLFSGMVAYLDSKPIIGRQYHCWDNMYGEHNTSGGESDLTAEESEWVIKTVLSDK